MSQGNSIFSSPNGSNGAAPANPFASLGGGGQKAASPFAATPEAPESPFGFAAEEPVAEQKAPVKLPEKKSMPAPENNPFQSAAAAPEAPASPFLEAAFEAPENPLSAPAPVGEVIPEPASAPLPASQPLASQSLAATAASQPLAAASQALHAASQPLQSLQATSQPLQAAAQSTPQAAQAAPASAGQSTRQLELRAIFGAEGEMSRDEILTRAKGLPGIREVAVVGPGEVAAVQTMGDVLARFGYGGAGAWQVTCSGGVMDFISGEGATLAVLREGRYAAGVWETLMIVARELGRL